MKTKSKVLSNKTKQKRNERERNRIKCLNSVYEKLKKHVPDAAKVKKISKFNLIMNAIKYIQLLRSKLIVGIHNNQYSYEQLSQSNNDQSIIEDKLNQDISQEISLSNQVQDNNIFFEDLENVIIEDYTECFETFNQQTNTYYNNQYIYEYRPSNTLYCQQFYQSNNGQSEIENNFNTDTIESLSQEITSLNYVKYNIQDLGNFNQETDRYNYNQYNNEYRHNNHYLSEQTNNDQIIRENNFNQNISQSFSQEINSFINSFQYLQNVI